MAESDIRDFDYTDAAWESLYDAVDDEFFLEQDAELIYKSLKHRLRFIPFGEYLKRYIYLKAELKGAFADVPLADYQLIIRSSFSDNCTPASFEPTTAKLSALSKNWLTQQSVKRKVVFLLGFGLRMSVEDVNTFLTKALREPEINPKDPFEAICWYCYRNGYNYLRFEKLWDAYERAPVSNGAEGIAYSEYTVGVRNNMYTIDNDYTLIAHLSAFKTSDNVSRFSITAKECFNSLYNEAKELVADLYNRREDEVYMDSLASYKEKLSRNERLYDYEKRERIEKFSSQKNVFTRDDITESDIEQIICAAIPKDRHGNLTPGKISKLNGQFAGKRFSRQRISEILSGSGEINRFDLITLNFFVFSQKLSLYPEAKQRYTAFLESTNKILEKCFMGSLYVQNPYECFLLMCILSVDPLGTYADVWELSYEK